MKNIFMNKKLIGLCFLAAICVSCKHPSHEDISDPTDNEITMELKKGKSTLKLDAGVSDKTPDWTKNPKGNGSLPSVKEDGSASNVNVQIMTGIKNLPAKDIAVKNVIFMFYENLTDDLIASAEEKYGELIINDLPQKLELTSSSIDKNKDIDTVIGYYLTDSCYKACGYATTGLITNSIFRQFKGSFGVDTSDPLLINSILMANPRPVCVIAKDTVKNEAKKGCSPASSNYTNEIYKSSFKYTSDFEEAVSCYKSEDVFFEGCDDAHKDKRTEANGLFTIFDSSVTVYPSIVQSVKFGLAWTESKADPDEGFAFVFYDSAERNDKEAALKNFDEGVAVAAKYVLENPDTILIVTSAALDGSTIPAFMLGNNVEEGKECTTLLDFVKTIIKPE
jgi:hypothetical protein